MKSEHVIDVCVKTVENWVPHRGADVSHYRNMFQMAKKKTKLHSGSILKSTAKPAFCITL